MESSEFKKLAVEFLRLFSITWKNLWLYSEYHPLGKSSLKKCYETLLFILNDRNEFSIGTVEDKILAEDMVIDEEKYIMSSLAKEFSNRNIHSLVFQRGLNREDLKALFDLLIMRPVQIKKMGGLTHLIEQKNIHSIQANTVKFGKITESQELVDMALAEHILTGAKAQIFSFEESSLSSGEGQGDSGSAILTKKGQGPAIGMSVDDLMRDPSKITLLFAKTLESIKLKSPKGGPLNQNEILAALERMGKMLYERSEGSWNRLKIVFARLLLSLKPEIQKFVVEQSHSHSIKDSFLRNLFSYLPEEKFGDLVATQYAAGLKGSRDLADFIIKLLPSKEKRERILPTIREKLLSAGMDDEKIEKIQEEIEWLHLRTEEKIRTLLHGEQIWMRPFAHVMEFIEETSKRSSKNETMALIQKYISGLIHPSDQIRKDVIENAIPLYIFMKGHKDFSSQRFKIQNLFFRRLSDERDPERFERIVKSIMATAASEMDMGDYSESILILEKLRSSAFEDFRNDPLRRDLIITEISQMAKEEFLKNVLEDFLTSPKETEAILPKLFEIFGNPAIRFLIERLGLEKKRKRRYQIASLLKSLKQIALPQLLNYLDDERWYLVRNIIFIIGEIADVTSVKFLKLSLQHADYKVRREVVRALQKIGGEEAMTLITEAIEDPEPAVAITAIESLGTAKNTKALRKMLKILSKSPPFEEASPLLRKSAIENLGKLKVKEAIPGLAQLIKKRGLLGSSEEPGLRLAAIKALAEIGGQEASEALIYASEKDPIPSLRKVARTLVMEK